MIGDSVNVKLIDVKASIILRTGIEKYTSDAIDKTSRKRSHYFVRTDSEGVFT